MMDVRVMDQAGSRKEQMAGDCECSKKHLGSKMCGQNSWLSMEVSGFQKVRGKSVTI